MRRKMPAVLTTVVAVVVIQLTMSLISIVLLLLLETLRYPDIGARVRVVYPYT